MNEASRDEKFSKILEDTQAHVRAYIAGMGVPPSDTDDIAQDVYLELYRNLDGMPADLEPIRWLKGIARNICLNHFRRESRTKTSADFEKLIEHLDATPSTFDDVEELKHGMAMLARCLQELSEKNREMLMMRYRDDQTSDKIADAFSTTAEAVRITLFRLRSKLRSCMGRKLEKPS